MKTEVYSWRLAADRKAELESAARSAGKSLARLLEQITADWLKRRHARNGYDDEQAAIRRRAAAAIGSIRGGDPMIASRASEIVRGRLIRKHAEESRASRRNH